MMVANLLIFIGKGNIKDLRIFPCTGQPCQLKLGTNVTVEADFIARKQINYKIQLIISLLIINCHCSTHHK